MAEKMTGRKHTEVHKLNIALSQRKRRDKERNGVILIKPITIGNVNGENVNTAKLNKEKVIKIRQLYKGGDITTIQLGEQFGVHNTTISSIINFKSWKHIT